MPLAPEFYRILIDCKNNWVLIKVVKIFAKLAVVEPRLASKIVGPIRDIMERTVAKSLLFECIRTVVSSLSDHESAVKLAASKIREFLAEDDPNLKYLGLRALSDLASRHLWVVLDNKDVVLKSLNDVDPNIKLASLRLLMSMVSEDNVAEITKVLVNYALKSDPEFCNEILRSLLATCSRNYYEIVFDFDWYVSLLGEMARIPHCQTGEEIESQLVDIGMRVNEARSELVKVGRDLLTDPALLGNPFLHTILSAAAWVSGEYVELSKNPFELMEALLQPRTSLLPPSIKAVYIQSTFKVLVFSLQSYLWRRYEVDGSSLANDMESLKVGNYNVEDISEQGLESPIKHTNGSFGDDNGNKDAVQEQFTLGLSEEETSKKDIVLKLLNLIETALGPLIWSHEVEVQERTQNILGVLQIVKQNILFISGQNGDRSGTNEIKVSDITNLFDDLFEEELGPIAVNAQTRIPLPYDLTLKDNLTDLDMIYSDIQLNLSTSFSLGTSRSRKKDDDLFSDGVGRVDSESATVSESLLAQHRKRHGLYYLSSEKDGTRSNDYPLATETKDVVSLSDEQNDLVKLTEQSLTLKKKMNHAKARPVVVKLDDGENFMPTKKLEYKDDLLSDAVRDVLLGNEEVSTSLRYGEAGKPSIKRKGKETLVINSPPDLRLHSVTADAEVGNTSSRRSKHRNHSKERRQCNHGESGKGKEERPQEEKNKSCRHHRKPKAEQKESGSNTAVQTLQIPDFLL
ncbi:AP-3 complex subunit delta [Bienertia sinuspersici]